MPKVRAKAESELGRLIRGGAGKPKLSGPLWAGPCGAGENGGVTQSLLGRFLSCRERFRLYAVEGLRPPDDFNHRLHYGSMFHCAAENAGPSVPGWKVSLHNYCRNLCGTYPLRQRQIVHWHNVCVAQYPCYEQFWEGYDGRHKTRPVLREEPFDVPYELPSGRTVRLRGKVDVLDLATVNGRRGLWLLERKTKGDIDADELQAQLKFDLQTMFYAVALARWRESDGAYVPPTLAAVGGVKFLGVLYDVVRRPLSGGKHAIRPHRPTKKNPRGETGREFYHRLGGLIAEEPDHYFMRWRVGLADHDLTRFRLRCLDAVLEQMCGWYDWVIGDGRADPFASPLHWRTPYGFHNPLADGGRGDVDHALDTGEAAGLRRADHMFDELR